MYYIDIVDYLVQLKNYESSMIVSQAGLWGYMDPLADQSPLGELGSYTQTQYLAQPT